MATIREYQVTSGRLIEIPLKHTRDAAAMFNQRMPDGSTPIVLVPPPRGIFSWMMSVPADAYVMMQKCGKHYPSQPAVCFEGAGFKTKPPWYKMAYLVTKQACTFNCPVSKIPTKDNILVDVDLSIVFTISNPYDFVYKLGVLRFDEYLSAATSEAIRGMIRDVPHNQLLDLKSSFDGLNMNFSKLGVHFTNVNVTDCRLPAGLMTLLERIQTFTVLTQEEDATHGDKMKALKNTMEVTMRKLHRDHDLKVQELDAQKKLAAGSLKEDVAKLEETSKIQIQEAKNKAMKMVRQAEMECANAVIRAEKESYQEIEKAKAIAKAARLKAEAEANTIRKQAEADFRETENFTKGRLLEAEAESKAQEAFREKRNIQLESERLAVLAELAKMGRMTITGEDGTRLIDQIAKADLFGSKN